MSYFLSSLFWASCFLLVVLVIGFVIEKLIAWRIYRKYQMAKAK